MYAEPGSQFSDAEWSKFSALLATRPREAVTMPLVPHGSSGLSDDERLGAARRFLDEQLEAAVAARLLTG
ncbi:hypothetical protein ACFORO_19635 [Amycolatopsis halotolerans]|uniref:Uncharacterized protein n=1 Tax=Amycolatopsis halotolerans TaxID=330083 RepID=A0ABV7QKG5_9PSEU